MNTKYWTKSDEASIQDAAKVISAGGVVAFPTETVYGLGADATNTSAVKKVFQAKDRPADNPLIVHVCSLERVSFFVQEVTSLAKILITAFWPGPLTLVLPVKKGILSPLVTAGLDTVGVRMPDHPLALALIQSANCPLAAPSANRSSGPSPTRAEHVQKDLAGKIEGILEGGATRIGLESTVVTLKKDEIHILRPGAITKTQLQKALPATSIVSEFAGHPPFQMNRTPSSPGMKYVHYSPRAQVVIVKGEGNKMRQKVAHVVADASKHKEKVAVMACSENFSYYKGKTDLILDYGPKAEPDKAAQRLYHLLRCCDDDDISFVVVEAFSEKGIGLALMNRLSKAANGLIIEA